MIDRRLALLGGAALLLAACGRKGPIKKPDDSYIWPRTYPAPATVVPGYQGDVQPAPGPATLEQPIEPGFEDPDDALSIENE
ncbi:MAG: lipoprotein [Kiloniellales bacterium]